MLLAESKKYIISNEYETAYLIDKQSGRKISEIAEMYGDPAAAKISGDEKFCVVIGCGAVVYWLKMPFEDISESRICRQCYSVLPDIWFEEIVSMDNGKIMLRSESNVLYEIDVYTGNTVCCNAH